MHLSLLTAKMQYLLNDGELFATWVAFYFISLYNFKKLRLLLLFINVLFSSQRAVLITHCRVITVYSENNLFLWCGPFVWEETFRYSWDQTYNYKMLLTSFFLENGV
jgi:hypothetical protein